MRTAYLFLGLMLATQVAAQEPTNLEASINSSCGDAEPVISILDPSKLYSHPGDSDEYSQELCVSGIEEAEIKSESCEQNTSFYITSSGRDAHVSFSKAYNLNVCTSNMKMRVTSLLGACDTKETALFSVSGESNAHVADIGVFQRTVCGSYIKPENVSLEMNFVLTGSDDVYFSRDQATAEESFNSSAYPYIVSEGDGYVSRIVSGEFLRAERRIEEINYLRITREGNSASFILPFTEGSISDIEDREREVTTGSFLEQVEPNFVFFIPESAVVKLIYNPDINLSSDIDIGARSYDFLVKKTGDDEVSVEVLR